MFVAKNKNMKDVVGICSIPSLTLQLTFLSLSLSLYMDLPVLTQFYTRGLKTTTRVGDFTLPQPRPPHAANMGRNHFLFAFYLVFSPPLSFSLHALQKSKKLACLT
jgi:hypothetical protein